MESAVDRDVVRSMEAHPVLHNIIVKFVEASDEVGGHGLCEVSHFRPNSCHFSSHVMGLQQWKCQVLTQAVGNLDLVGAASGSEEGRESVPGLNLRIDSLAEMKSERKMIFYK